MAAKSQSCPNLLSVPPAQPSTKNPTPTTLTPSQIVIFFFLPIVFILVGIAFLIDYFSPPINEMSSYTVTSATVDPFNISSLQLTAAWNISIYIKNYGWLGDMHFESVQSSIYYGSHLLSHVSIPCFFLESNTHKILQDRLMAHSKSLDVDVAESMIRERLSRGAVDFRVELLAWTKSISCSCSRYGGPNKYASGWMKFKISCDNVTVEFPAMHDVGPGVMLGSRRKCSVLVDKKTKKPDCEEEAASC